MKRYGRRGSPADVHETLGSSRTGSLLRLGEGCFFDRGVVPDLRELPNHGVVRRPLLDGGGQLQAVHVAVIAVKHLVLHDAVFERDALEIAFDEETGPGVEVEFFR